MKTQPRMQTIKKCTYEKTIGTAVVMEAILNFCPCLCFCVSINICVTIYTDNSMILVTNWLQNFAFIIRKIFCSPFFAHFYVFRTNFSFNFTLIRCWMSELSRHETKTETLYRLSHTHAHSFRSCVWCKYHKVGLQTKHIETL